jgi:Rrf2 family protein
MGVHALALLASDPERTLTSEEIATGIGTNPVVVRRILSALQEAGLVTSQKGPTGGSRLAQAAKKISLAGIYQAIEKKPVFYVPYSSGSAKSAHAKKVAGAVKDVFRSADGAVVAELSGISLSQIVKRTQRGKK